MSFNHGIQSKIKHKADTLILLSDNLIRLSNGRVYHYSLPAPGLCLYADTTRILIGTQQGILEYDQNYNLKYRYLNEEFITGICKDFEGGFWFSTVQSGVFYAENINLIKIMTPSKLTANTLYSSKKRLEIYDKTRNVFWIYSFDNQKIDSIQNISNSDGIIQTNNPKILNYFESKSRVNFSISESLNEFNNRIMIVTKNKNYFSVYGNLLEKKESFLYNVSYPYSGKLKCVYELNDSTLLLGMDNGLYDYNLRTKKLRDKIIIGDKDKVVKQIFKLKEKVLILSKSGIFQLLNQNISLVNHYPKIDFNTVNGVYTYKDSLAWLFDKGSIYEISIKADTLYLKRINSLPEVEIISANYRKNKLFIGTKNSIIQLDYYNETIEDKIPTRRFTIDSIHINESKVSEVEYLVAKAEEDLIIFFKMISFKSSNKDFEYQFDSEKWQNTNKNSIIINRLPSGEHTLKIRLKNYPETILHKKIIVVKRPLIKTPWFIFLLVCIGILIVFLAFKTFYTFRDKKKQQKLEHVNLELKLFNISNEPTFHVQYD